MYERALQEIRDGAFYRDNFPNDGQRFVAWYLRRVLSLDVHATVAAITDGPLDKQIDAIVVEDGEERRIRVIQGKFLKPQPIDATPLREVLSAWMRLKDLRRLQLDCSGKLAERLEAMRLALEDDYEVHLELLTTGTLTPAAAADFEAFREQLADDAGFGASLVLVDAEMLESRLADAEQRDLPELTATIALDAAKTLVTEESGVRVVLAMLPLSECLKLPGIADGKLFRRNVRQSLGLSNKVNKQLRATLSSPEKAPYFFFYHNGITALAKSFKLSEDRASLEVSDLSVVNGCQSLSTIYSTSAAIAGKKKGQAQPSPSGSVLLRIYEIPQRDLSEQISVFTNSQSAVKPRDLRSNDKYMRAVKKRYESVIPGSYFITKRGEERPADKEAAKTLDAPDYARMVVAWMCQRPNLAHNEKKLFDELYKMIFHPELDAASILALRSWLLAIDQHWDTLDINEAVKATRGSARFHLLYVVSLLFSHASGQADKVSLPSATQEALKFAPMILSQAKNCLNKALETAIAQSRTASKVFSAQNWLKGTAALHDERLVTSMVVDLLGSMAQGEMAQMIKSLRIPAEHFAFRWQAE
jgi:hypothetical protein